MKTNALSALVPLTPSECQSMAIYLELHTNTDNKLHTVQSFSVSLNVFSWIVLRK